MFILVLAFMLGACSKDNGSVAPEGNNIGDKDWGQQKSNTMYVFRYMNGNGPYEFTVQQGGYCIGKVRSSLVLEPTFPGQQLVGNGYMWTNGTCPTSTSICRFDKGGNATTWGQWYIIVPNQGATQTTRSVLKFRMKGVLMPGVGGGTHRYFTYDVATNIWSLGQEGVIAEFDGILEHQTITGVPECMVLPGK